MQDREAVTYKLKMIVRAAIFDTLAYEGFRGYAEVSVCFCDNAQIQGINKKYRNMDNATDVLSFPQFERGEKFVPSFDGRVTLGDIVISLQRAREQSREFGHSFGREIAFLCAHSTLHLLGYDHETPEEEHDMRRRQRIIMKIMGMAVNENEQPEQENCDTDDGNNHG